jgi:hypothetical protein
MDEWGWNPAAVGALGTASASVFAVVAVVFAAMSWRVSKKQTVALVREIDSRMRPWVGLFDFDFTDDMGDQRLRILLRNFGPLPAQKADLDVVVCPHQLIAGEQPNPARICKDEEKTLMPTEEGNYAVRLSPYPQVATWISDNRDILIRGTFSYALGSKRFESKFVVELWFSRARRGGSVQRSWRNVSAS